MDTSPYFSATITMRDNFCDFLFRRGQFLKFPLIIDPPLIREVKKTPKIAELSPMKLPFGLEVQSCSGT